jgi:hypothetical protein
MLYLTYLILGTLLTWLCVVRPVREGARMRQARTLRLDYQYLKLRSIRDYYPAVRDLSLREIEAQYNVDLSYQNIGLDLLER